MERNKLNRLSELLTGIHEHVEGVKTYNDMIKHKQLLDPHIQGLFEKIEVIKDLVEPIKEIKEKLYQNELKLFSISENIAAIKSFSTLLNIAAESKTTEGIEKLDSAGSLLNSQLLDIENKIEVVTDNIHNIFSQ